MKHVKFLVLILALAMPASAGCSRPGQAATPPFEALARWVPADAEQPIFLDLKPAGEAGRHWERIRQRLESNPSGKLGLDALEGQFRVGQYGLGEALAGPVVSWDDVRASHIIAQVADEGAAAGAMLRHFATVEWEHEILDDTTLYHGRDLGSWQGRTYLAWAVQDGFLFLAYQYDRDALAVLREQLGVEPDGSLASLPVWQRLRDRLPPSPMALAFMNISFSFLNSDRANTSGSESLGEALNRHIVAHAFAVVPEEQGIRVEIASEVALPADAPADLRALFNQPAVDPAAWTGLPSSAAFTLVGHDGPLLWPLLRDMFDLGALEQLAGPAGLDLGADLFGAGGPLAGDFAIALTPPLPDQPISQGVPAGQLLVLAQGTSEAQVADLQAAMEGRGAVFGPREVEGVPLQTQLGTEASGYAVSFGFDGDAFLFGSSPEAVGQAVAARRGQGLVTTDAFQTLQAALPDEITSFVTINCGQWTRLVQANMIEEQYQNSEAFVFLEAFDAIGIGLRFPPDGKIKGVAYFLMQ